MITSNLRPEVEVLELQRIRQVEGEVVAELQSEVEGRRTWS